MSNRFVEQGLSAPVNLTWEVTLACNLRCRHCLSASGHPAPRELGTREALHLVDQLHGAGVFQVNFGGGEPFLRPDFEAILEACHDRRLMTCVSTNGTLLTAERAERLPDDRDNLAPGDTVLLVVEAGRMFRDSCSTRSGAPAPSRRTR